MFLCKSAIYTKIYTYLCLCHDISEYSHDINPEKSQKQQKPIRNARFPTGFLKILTPTLSFRISGTWLAEMMERDAKNKGRSQMRSPFGTPQEIRTPDLLVRSQTLYPAELAARVSTTAWL